MKRHSLFNPLHVGLLLSNLLCFYCRLLIFFKIYFFKIFFQKHYQNVKQFCLHQDRCFARPDLGPNLFVLQRVSSNNKVTAYMVRVLNDSSSFGIEIVIGIFIGTERATNEKEEIECSFAKTSARERFYSKRPEKKKYSIFRCYKSSARR